MNVLYLVSMIGYIVLAPIFGLVLAGLDRKVSARMQRRVGPPVVQPYYDVRKLMEKDQVTVNKVQDFYVFCFLLFIVITGCIFFAGGDLLLVVFTLTLANVFLVLAAYSSNSPYSQVGAERELYQMMAYEPMVLLTMIGFYLAVGSFNVSDILNGDKMPIVTMVGIFVGFLFILTIKFRKSPFDLSMSHHAHQDIVKGVTTEFSGRTLAYVEIAHWYENIMLLGIVFLFFCNGTWWGYVIGVVVAAVSFFLETFIDNSFARMKWQVALKSSWVVSILFGLINVALLIWVF
ncbi:MAG: NADH-quinone oxidoreductase subunit H [Candidatus Methanomethylophilaceae archaeon]|nr:NADH-quinone oxidoreductase subunit H [Candidatus Methanomethylophilaceae archaeon]MDD3378508.1 NADH-quinone oxidoreductase subunit H [Candidatus Methanomethylophilaceae archaeon]MDY0224428.1 NADH-quinone oxidoreductase subunit H [Candidatus Methanomethylophilaceae archaeon]